MEVTQLLISMQPDAYDKHIVNIANPADGFVFGCWMPLFLYLLLYGLSLFIVHSCMTPSFHIFMTNLTADKTFAVKFCLIKFVTLLA